VSILKTTGEAMAGPGWWHVMVEKMINLHSRGTWELIPLEN